MGADGLRAEGQVQLAVGNRPLTVPFTASWGLTDSASGGSFAEMVAVADAALYQAKRAGRNCIMIDGEAARHHAELPVDEVWADHHDGQQAVPGSSSPAR